MTDTLIFSFERSITATDLVPLYQQADWTRQRSLEQIEEMLDNTPICLGVWKGGRLVGFARVLTDELFRALIDDVIVDKEFRSMGIGKRMIKELVQRLDNVELVVLGCEHRLVKFYEGLGFKKSIHSRMEIRKA